MEIKVKRIYHGKLYTIGRLSIGGQYICDTMEPPWRDFGMGRRGEKVPGRTAIPEGRYLLVVTFSQRFQKWLPLLIGVYGFSGVRIHAGNTVADTQGCLLVGQNRVVGKVVNSRAAMERLMARIREAERFNEPIHLTIT